MLFKVKITLLTTLAFLLCRCYSFQVQSFVVKPMSTELPKPEFWETAFIGKKEMWGLEPSPSSGNAKDFFLQHGVKTLLIPGVGYGRNAQVFKNAGMTVTGIEISSTAIDMAREHFGNDMVIHHGSVSNMPFDDNVYDGIFSYAVIHLLSFNEREKFIRDCYNQLKQDGYMIFVSITKEAPMYRKGLLVEKDRYDMNNGAPIFFYDRDTIQEEFGPFGLVDVTHFTL